MPLSANERHRITARISELESRHPVQAVASVVDKSDAYPELPWRAFALGVSLGTLALLLTVGRSLPGLPAGFWLLFPLLAGLALMAGSLIPTVARWFLFQHRAETEARQLAETQFLAHELFATKERCGVLLFISSFERVALLRADRGVTEMVGGAGLRHVGATMQAALLERGAAGAIEAGLEALDVEMQAQAGAARAANEIAEALIEEQGHS